MTSSIDEKSALSAKYLDQDVNLASATGPTVTKKDPYQNNASFLTGADGKKYVFVPRSYVEKGDVAKGVYKDENGKLYSADTQWRNVKFLNQDTFKNAAQMVLPGTETDGFVWSLADYNSLGLGSYAKDSISGYKITDTSPPIAGIGYPTAAPDSYTKTVSYVSAPFRISDNMAGQQFIAPDGTRYDGSRGWEYVLNGWAWNTIRKGLPYVDIALPVLITVTAGPEAAKTYMLTKAATQATINAAQTGDWEKGLIDVAKVYAAQQIGDVVGGQVNAFLPVDASMLAKTMLTSATTNSLIAGLYGKDVGKAFIDGGIAGGISAAAGQINGFKELPVPVRKVFAAAVTAELQGKSKDQLTQSVLETALTSGIAAMANGIAANSMYQKELGREATAEELNKYIWYTDAVASKPTIEKDVKSIKSEAALESGLDSITFDGKEIKIPEADLKSYAAGKGFSSFANYQEAAGEKPADYYAKKLGFDDALDKFAAEDAGYAMSGDWKEYKTAINTGFEGLQEYRDAKAIGASTPKEFDSKIAEVNKKFNSTLGRDATADEISSIIGGGTDVAKTANTIIAPQYTDKDEVNKIFQANLGRDATKEELAKFVGATSDSVTAARAGEYIAPLYTTEQEVNQLFQQFMNRNATPEEVAQFVGPTKDTDSQANIDKYTNPMRTTEDEVIKFFQDNIGRDPTASEIAKFVGITPDKTTLTQKNAEEKLINGLDLPEDYKFPDLKTAVSFSDAFAAARDAYGPNATFTWTDHKTGIERKYVTGTETEVKNRAIGDYDALTYNYVKKQMLGDINDPNLNPADLTKTEMAKFIDSFANATPAQRQKMLTGADSMTYQAINEKLTQALPNVKVTPNTTGTGTLKESDLTNYAGILKTGANTAAADIAGLATRGVQVLGDVFGMDTDTLSKAQDLLTKDKDTMMSKLVGNEKAVAGGIASGIESAVSYTLGGPAAAIGSLTGIAANNAWIEGEKAGLSTMDNAQRTAVMATLEAAGEAVGIPGLSRLMKGVPAGATGDQIVAYVKNVGLAMGNEQLSELATTAAQFGVDKFSSFGLGKNATFSDFSDALKDTVVSTVFAVGSSGSIGAATRALQNSSTAPTDVIRTEVTPEVAWRRATDAGMTADDLVGIKSAIEASINNGDMTTMEAKDAVIADLQNVGFTPQEASRIANAATADVVEGGVSAKLQELNIPADQLGNLSSSITNQIMKGEDLKTSVDAVGKELQTTTGMDSLESLLAANKILTGMNVTDEVKNTLSTYNYNATPEQINQMILGNVGSNKSGLASNVVETKVSDIFSNSGLSSEAISSLAPLVSKSVLSGEGLDTSVSTIANQIAKSTGNDILTSSIIANEALTGSNIKTEIGSHLGSLNYTPTEQELNDLINQNLTSKKTDVGTKIDEYVDPRYVDQQEALTALNQNLATQITPAQLQMLIGQYNESGLPDKAIESVLAGNLAVEEEADAEKKRKAAIAAKGQAALAQPSSAGQSTAKQFGQPTSPNQSSTSPLSAVGALAPTFLSSKGVQEKFQGALDEFERLQDQPFAGENQYEGIAPDESTQAQTTMNDSYYNYGQNSSIDDVMSNSSQSPDWLNAVNQGLVTQPGGLVNEMFAMGGSVGTRHGRYAAGGLSTPLMAAGGKMRVDFRQGDAVTGAGDGQSDDIPAMLADGEFVFPADVVAALGNGSTKAGSDKLYDMMHGIRAHVRSAKPKDLPPEIKSPLDFLKTKPRKAGRK